MWPWILGSAALGGLTAYGQSGGDIGKTLTGAAIGGGLGALGPLGSRFAGTALASTPLATRLAPSVYKAGQLFAKGEGATSLINPLAQQMVGRELIAKGGAGLAGLGISAAIPTVAAGLAGAGPQAANAATRMAGNLGSGGLTAAGTAKEALYQAPSGELNLPGVPNVSGYGAERYQDVASLTSPQRAAALASRIYSEQELENAKRTLPYMAGLSRQIADADLLRQLAARQQVVRQNTGAQSMLQAQLGAQQGALNAQQGVINAMAQRGGYV